MGTFARVKPYSLRSFFHLSAQRYPQRMGSHARRQPETRMVPVLNCQACGGLTSGARFRYVCGRLICDHCGAENPDTRVSHVQIRDIFIRFITAGGCSVQAMDLDLDRPPWPVRARRQPGGPAPAPDLPGRVARGTTRIRPLPSELWQRQRVRAAPPSKTANSSNDPATNQVAINKPRDTPIQVLTIPQLE
jgi:hypothetical protein